MGRNFNVLRERQTCLIIWIRRLLLVRKSSLKKRQARHRVTKTSHPSFMILEGTLENKQEDTQWEQLGKRLDRHVTNKRMLKKLEAHRWCSCVKMNKACSKAIAGGCRCEPAVGWLPACAEPCAEISPLALQKQTKPTPSHWLFRTTKTEETENSKY